MAHPRPDVLQFALNYKPTQPAYPTHKDRLVRSAGSRCVDCGYEYTGQNGHHFDFHHRDPEEKEGNVAVLALGGLEKAAAEAAKCDLLCKFCHADRHIGKPKKRRRRQDTKAT